MSRPARPTLSPTATQALADYEQYLRTERDVSPATLRNYLSDLRQGLLRLGNRRRVTAAGPRPGGQAGGRGTPSSATPHRPAGITPDRGGDRQRQRPDRVLLIVMLHTGLRAGEVCGLQRDDVSLGPRSGSLRIWGKRNKYREVPLNVTARAALHEWLEQLPPDQRYLFPSPRTDRGLTPRALGQLVKKYAKAAGVPDLHPHDLRHRFGYRMAEGVPLHRLAQIMGHDSLDTTRLHTQATAAHLQQEVEKIAWE